MEILIRNVQIFQIPNLQRKVILGNWGASLQLMMRVYAITRNGDLVQVDVLEYQFQVSRDTERSENPGKGGFVCNSPGKGPSINDVSSKEGGWIVDRSS
jgi:hypothetical protein